MFTIIYTVRTLITSLVFLPRVFEGNFSKETRFFLRFIHTFFSWRSLPTSSSILGNIAEVHPLWEDGRVVIDILQVDLHICIAHQPFSSFVLSKHGEPPLGSTSGLVPVQRLEHKRKDKIRISFIYCKADISKYSKYLPISYVLKIDWGGFKFMWNKLIRISQTLKSKKARVCESY